MRDVAIPDLTPPHNTSKDAEQAWNEGRKSGLDQAACQLERFCDELFDCLKL